MPGEGIFPMIEILDEAGNLWHKSKQRRDHLNQGVDGAHICVAFQCEICWMRNLEGREITPEDDFYVSLICRANLDAMTGMSKLTIATHRRTVAAKVER